MLGMAIGVSAVFILTALGEGARQYIINQFAVIGSNLLVIVPGKTETTGAIPGFGGTPHDLTLEDTLILQRQIPQAKLIVPISMGTETVTYRERRRQIAVVGATADFLEARNLTLRKGHFLPRNEVTRGSQVVVLGDVVARELFPGEEPLGRTVRVGGWRLRVIGVLAKHGTQLGMNADEIVVVPVATGMRMFNRHSLFRILIKTPSHRHTHIVCQRAVEILTKRHGEEDVTCITQDAVVSTFSSILQTFTWVLAAIGGISLTVAGIGIMNLMLVTVSERTEEVGLLKALGVRYRQILIMFLTEASLLGTAGGCLGLALGWSGLLLLQFWYPYLPTTAPFWALVSVLSVSIGVGMIFGVVPARKAARLDPIEALEKR